MTASPRLLLCRCTQAQVLPSETVDAIWRRVQTSGLEVAVVDDLCQLAAKRDPLLRQLAASDAPLILATCHPRAVRCLFAAADAPLQPNTRFLNLRTGDWAALCTELPEADAARVTETPASGGCAWFPVLDLERCTSCMQCLGFCLFGVYAAEGGSVRVAAPQRCKPGCPACARVCPQGAILFPKHATAPINGGESAFVASKKVDLSAVFGGDIYAALRQRNAASRFSKDRDPATAQAERHAHLAALVQAGELPAELLEDWERVSRDLHG